MFLTNENMIKYGVSYALGRMTFAPSTINDNIRRNVNSLSTITINEILESINKTNRYGMSCDKETWMNLKDFLSNAKKPKEHKSDSKIKIDMDTLIFINRGILETLAGFREEFPASSVNSDYLSWLESLVDNCNILHKNQKQMIMKDYDFIFGDGYNLSNKDKEFAEKIKLNLLMSLALDYDNLK